MPVETKSPVRRRYSVASLPRGNGSWNGGTGMGQGMAESAAAGATSQQLHLGQILHVDQPDRPARVIHNYEIVDLEPVENPQRLDRERIDKGRSSACGS